MAEFSNMFDKMDDPYAEMEAALRAAGSYVRASDDLRPRVMEAIRAERGERRIQRSIRIVAAALVVLGASTPFIVPRLDAVVGFHPSSQLAGGSDSLIVRAQAAGHGADLAWGLVKTFSELRQRQADAINRSP